MTKCHVAIGEDNSSRKIDLRFLVLSTSVNHSHEGRERGFGEGVTNVAVG